MSGVLRKWDGSNLRTLLIFREIKVFGKFSFLLDRAMLAFTFKIFRALEMIDSEESTRRFRARSIARTNVCIVLAFNSSSIFLLNGAMTT